MIEVLIGIIIAMIVVAAVIYWRLQSSHEDALDIEAEARIEAERKLNESIEANIESNATAAVVLLTEEQEIALVNSLLSAPGDSKRWN